MGNAAVTDSTNKLSSRSTDDQIREFILKENSSHQVVVWSKSRCLYCEKAISSLQKRCDDVKVHNLDKHKLGEAVQDILEELTSQATVPSVFINGVHIGGNSEVQSLKKSGELKAMLKKSSRRPSLAVAQIGTTVQ